MRWIGLFALVGWLGSPMFAGSLATANTIDIEVMTFNIRYGTANDGANHWDQRKNLVFSVIQQEDCDVVGVQEALRSQLDAILEAVPQYHAVGVGREDGKAAGEFSPILYKHERFDLLDSGTFWLSETPETAGSKSWGSANTRICTWARLQEKATWKTLYVYNTHLDHRSSTARFGAVELIADRMAQRAHQDPMILMGDFNAPEDSDPMRFLRGEISGPAVPKTLERGWTDTFRAAHPEAKLAGTFNGFTGYRKGPKIDYVLVRPGAAYVLEAYILDWNKNARYPSDHFPVVSRVLLGKPRFD